jgi:ADP-ribose pyrophosphatase YjhB (NUDIX family)
MAQRTHAGAIVARFNGKPEFLLITTAGKSDEWTFPKGHIERGELPEDAAMREVREEAGVLTEIVEVVGESSFARTDETITVIYYLLRCTGRVETRENRSVLWCDYDAALRTLSFEDARAILIAARPLVQRSEFSG